jgi:hypothetical protein
LPSAILAQCGLRSLWTAANQVLVSVADDTMAGPANGSKVTVPPYFSQTGSPSLRSLC